MRVFLYTLLVCLLCISALAIEAPEAHQVEAAPQQAHEHHQDIQAAVDFLIGRVRALLKSYDRKRQDVNEQYDWNDFQDKQVKELWFVISLLPYRIKTKVMEYVEANGVNIGSRWKIYEQGLDGSLIFKDMLSTAHGSNSRYHFSRRQHVDL